MFSSDKIKKLEELAGKLSKADVHVASEWFKSKTAAKPRRKKPRATSLEEAVKGEVLCREEGRCYYINKSLVETWSEGKKIVKLYKNVLYGSGQMMDPSTLSAGLQALSAAPPQTITYLDIETCGFSGNAVFLIGWCYFNGKDLVVEQVLARDYSEETALIAMTAERLAQTQVLVTYNGKAFDLPFISDRAIIHRVKMPAIPTHLDMLHEARSHWKHLLPNCKLQTLERFICSRSRHGDIPGAEIPQAYHDYVKSGNAGKMAAIIEHNFLDVVTLADVTVRLLAGQDPGIN